MKKQSNHEKLTKKALYLLDGNRLNVLFVYSDATPDCTSLKLYDDKMRNDYGVAKFIHEVTLTN